MSGEGYKPSEAEIKKGEDMMRADGAPMALSIEGDKSMTREFLYKGVGRRLQETTNEFRLDVQKALDSFPKKLSEADGRKMFGETLPGELAEDEEEAKKIAADISQKLEELKKLKFGSPNTPYSS